MPEAEQQFEIVDGWLAVVVDGHAEGVLPLVDVEKLMTWQADLLVFHQKIRVLMGYPAMAPVDEAEVIVAEVELLAQRFHGEGYEPGTISTPDAGRRAVRVDEDLVLASNAVFRCIPDGEVRQGCTISNGAKVKRWHHHAARAARETIRANRAAANVALAAMVDMPDSTLADTVRTRLKEIADA